VDEKTGRQGPSCGRRDILEQLTTYVISSFYPEVGWTMEDLLVFALDLLLVDEMLLFDTDLDGA
jgi:hypothetical protein